MAARGLARRCQDLNEEITTLDTHLAQLTAQAAPKLLARPGLGVDTRRGRSVLDAFHVVKLGSQAVEEVRRRVQQTIHGHRGRNDDPLYRIRDLLRYAKKRLTERHQTRLAVAVEADERHLEVFVACLCAQQLRRVYHQRDPAAGRRLAEKIINSFPSCPIPEIARLGRTLKKWRREFRAYFDTAGASNGGTEAVNDLIELHRRIARGFRNRD